MIYGNGDWPYYVEGHDPAELWEIDDPADLDFERVWMRPIRSSACYADWPNCDCDPDDFVGRGADGRFKARYCRTECRESDAGAEPWMACRYKPSTSTTDDLGSSPESDSGRLVAREGQTP